MNSLQFAWLRRGERPAGIRPLLEITGLTVRTGIREVLRKLDMEVYPGDHIRISGPNGCGKSTLLNAIAGVVPARIDEGRIFFEGREITRLPAHERAALGIAYMRQTDNVFPDLTIADNLALALGNDGYDRFARTYLAWATDLTPWKRAGQLSGGQRKKLAWAMTYLRDTSLLFLLDEPRAGMAEGGIEIGIRNPRQGILEIEHNG